MRHLLREHRADIVVQLPPRKEKREKVIAEGNGGASIKSEVKVDDVDERLLWVERSKK